MNKFKLIESAAMEYFKSEGPEWSEVRRRFSEQEANAFFVGVMLDWGQDANRAWEGGEHLVNNHFNKMDNFWEDVATTHLNTVIRICRTGYEGKQYANRFNTYKKKEISKKKRKVFPEYLKENAKKIMDDYEGDVRNVWNGVRPEEVDVIYDRFMEFAGIGDALAKMAQFILVRKYGIAGGKGNKKKMKVKPDLHVRRVLYRLGLGIAEKRSKSKRSKSVFGSVKSIIDATENMKLKSPADFDWAIFDIGRNYCFKSKPNCSECHLNKVCQKRLS